MKQTRNRDDTVGIKLQKKCYCHYLGIVKLSVHLNMNKNPYKFYACLENLKSRAMATDLIVFKVFHIKAHLQLS